MWRKRSVSSSVMSDSLQLYGLQPTRLLYPWGFPRQEYWSGLPRPSPGDLPSPGIKPWSPTLQADSLPSEPPGKPGEKRNRKYQFSSKVICQNIPSNPTSYAMKCWGKCNFTYFCMYSVMNQFLALKKKLFFFLANYPLAIALCPSVQLQTSPYNKELPVVHILFITLV